MNYNQNSIEPTIGGADLECLFKCKKPLKEEVLYVLEICKGYGFYPLSEKSLLAYGEDPIEPSIIADASNIDSFIESIKSLNSQRCIIKLDGVLHDIKTSMSLIFDMTENVLVIGVPEDVLWGFSSDVGEADVFRLKQFAICCEAIAGQVSAVLGYIGTEHVHPEDMVAGVDSEISHIDDAFFSEERMQELFDWYVNFYVRRWDKKN